MSEDYSEVHRVLLTYIRMVKCISVEALTEKFKVIAQHFDIEADNPQSVLRDYIGQINVKISRAYFKIDAIRDQETDEQYFVFVNTKFDEIIQQCTAYSPPELEGIKQVIDSIINAHGYAFALPYVNAKQQITTALTKASESVSLIARLVDDGWINLTEQNRLTLSATALSELSTYLSDRYGVFSASDTSGKLLKCLVCGDYVTLGKKCASSQCPNAFHYKCFGVYSRDNQVCSNRTCSEALTEVIDVGTPRFPTRSSE